MNETTSSPPAAAPVLPLPTREDREAVAIVLGKVLLGIPADSQELAHSIARVQYVLLRESPLLTFATAVQRVRTLQREYFKGRDRGVMIASKQAEKVVDDMLLQLLGAPSASQPVGTALAYGDLTVNEAMGYPDRGTDVDQRKYLEDCAKARKGASHGQG